MYGLGRVWTDQQWGAQLLLYGCGGSAVTRCSRSPTPSSSWARCRSQLRLPLARGGAEGDLALCLPVLLAAPWAWTIRAQLLALPLYTGLLWLLASEARRPTRRVYLAFPILVVWANLHGSVALGAMLAMLLGAVELLRTSRARLAPGRPPLVAAPLCLLVTPYSPVAMARYYRTLLVDPPFGRRSRSGCGPGRPGTPPSSTSSRRRARLVVWGRKRLSLFDIAVLAIDVPRGRLGDPRDSLVRARVPCSIFPSRSAEPGEQKPAADPPRIQHRPRGGGGGRLVVLVGYSLARPSSWYEQDWKPGRPSL